MESIWSLKRRPTMTAGIDPTIMYFKFLKKNGIFLRKKKRTEQRVAVLRKISKLRDGVKLKKY